MGRRRHNHLVRVAIGAVALGSAACASIIGLSEYDVEDPTTTDGAVAEAGTLEGSAGEASVGDAGFDGAPNRGCACTAPSGWAFVAFADNADAACPGDLHEVDRATDPKLADGGACSCAPCALTLPGCGDKWTSSYDTTAAVARCDKPSAVNNPVQDGGCVASNGVFGEHSRLTSPPPVGTASCTAAGVFPSSSATTRTVRLCEETGRGETCACKAAGGYAACIRAPGDVACPAGFAAKHVVGAAATATCSACGCATADVKCTGSTATFFSDNACQAKLFTVDDTTCQDTNTMTFKSFMFASPKSATATCKTTPPDAGAAALSLTESSTVCCP